MPTTNYYSVNGRIVGQKVAGQPASARVDYVTDALGSVVATADQTGAVQNTYRYKPYGGVLAKTGTAPDPAFTWVGSYGYRQTAKKYSDVYVRARHYSNSDGLWLTAEDFAETEEQPYTYAQCNPSNYIDPDGLAPQKSHKTGRRPKKKKTTCPRTQPPQDGDYAIACSNYIESKISASFTLPTKCDVRNSFINFYLSMGGFEAGVSFGYVHNGWNAFFNSQGLQKDVSITLGPGQTVSMSLTRKKSGVVVFVINGQSVNSSPKKLSSSGLDQVRLVNAAGFDSNSKCPTAHSVASWGGINVKDGMQSKAWTRGAEKIVSNLFSSKLRNPTLPCDSSQYNK